MVHFRKIATHQYERMNIDIVIQVIQSGLNDLVAFTDRVKEFCQNHPS